MAKNILFLSSTGNGFTATSHLEHIGAFKQHSRHNIFYHNFVYNLSPSFDFSPFDVIVIGHNFWPEILTEEQRTAIRSAPALKIQFLQDEYQYVRTINAFLEEMGIQVMFTCVAEKDFDTFYPRSIMKSLVAVEPNLTGYVSDALASPANFHRGKRPTDIGYRSRVSPFFLGQLGHEKLRIAEVFKDLSKNEGLSSNISIREEDRIYGPDWLRFLQSTRVQLGTPSGASVVDMDGSLVERELSFRRRHPHAPFEKFSEQHLAEHEEKLKIDTVSPRIFEYAATGTAMVLLKGAYGGHITPDEHYISIEKDYSNLSDVVEKIRDQQYCRQLAENAHEHLIKSGTYSYKNFVRRFDDVVDTHCSSRLASEHKIDEAAFNDALVEDHDQALFFHKKGWRFANTPTGKQLRARNRHAKILKAIPVIGKTLRKTGGDPQPSFEQMKLAWRLALRVPEYRDLFTLWLRARRHMPGSNSLTFARELMQLGLIQSGQAGLAYTGQAFHTKVSWETAKHRLVLTSTPSEPGVVCPLSQSIDAKGAHPPDFWIEIEQAVRTGEIDRILWDMTNVFPLQQFAVATAFPAIVRGETILLRSEPDQYFHFSTLDALSRFASKKVLYALRIATSASFGPDQKAIVAAFEKA